MGFLIHWHEVKQRSIAQILNNRGISSQVIHLSFSAAHGQSCQPDKLAAVTRHPASPRQAFFLKNQRFS
jgi:hypothetical protein